MVLILGHSASSATAVLECAADAQAGAADGHAVELTLSKTVFMTFQFQTVREWKNVSGALLLHLAAGTAPKRLEISLARVPWSEKPAPAAARGGEWRSYAVEAQKDGWIRVKLSAGLLQPLVSGSATGLRLRGAGVIHARESLDRAPHLLLDGDPRVQ